MNDIETLAAEKTFPSKPGEGKFVEVTRVTHKVNDEIILEGYQIMEGFNFSCDELTCQKLTKEKRDKAFLSMFELIQKAMEVELEDLCRNYRAEMRHTLEKKYGYYELLKRKYRFKLET
jgi:c-di-GMP-related signal transduction protein